MHTRTQLFVLLILFSLISNSAQTFPVTDEQVCPRQSSNIIQYVEQQASEIDASQVPRDLFNANEGGKFGWEAKLLGMVNKKLDKWLWSWMPSSKSDKLTALRLKFNGMMRESLAKIALLAVEGMPIRHAMLIVKGIMAKYLVPLAKDVSPELAENMSQLVGDDDMFDEKTGEKKESSNVPREDENFAEEESEAHPSAKMVNVAVAAAEDLLGDIGRGKYDKNVDGGKTFADSAIGQRLNGLRNKLLALLTGMLSKSTAMSLFMAFAKMPEILKEKNAATWGWMAKCAHDKVDGGAIVEPMAGEEIKELAVEKVQNTVVAHGMHGSAGQSGTDLFPHRRVKRRAFACCFPDTMFGHHYSTTSTVGYVAFIGYNMGLFISGFTFYFLTKLFWQSTDPYLHVGRSWVMNPGPHWCGGPKCARPYAVALGVLGTFGFIFLALLPYLNIY